MKKLKRESKVSLFLILKYGKLREMFFLIFFSCTQILLAEMPTESGAAGLDTIQASDEKMGDQGNWVKKKNWLLKSYEISSNIYKLANQIAQTKKIYQSKYNAIDEELDKFYKDLGMEQGRIKELFDSVGRYLEKKKMKDVAALAAPSEKNAEIDQDSTRKIDLLESQLKQMESDLEQLRLDMDAIADVDKSLTQRLQKVDEQITLSMTQAEAAKNKVESLWEIIDDKKARVIYYEVLNIEENLKAILSYLQNVLASDFDKVVSLAKEKIILTASNIKKLEEKGLIIKDRSHRIEQIKLEELRKVESEAMQAKKIEEEKPVVKKEQQLGIVQKIYLFTVDWVAKFYNFFKNLFSGKIAIQKTAQPKDSSATNRPSAESSTMPSASPADVKEKQIATTLVDSTKKSSTLSSEMPKSSPTGMPVPDQLTMPMP